MKISIVLPVYNTSNYLENNIESLINQTYKNIEIIYVDDGSTDNSASIIEKHMKKHHNIKLYQKENSGVAATRNYGLSKATGEYITFIDSDDTVRDNLCELLVDTIKETKNPDIVIFNYDIVYPDKRKPMNLLPFDSNFITPNEYMLTAPCPWNKFYKRSFLIDNKFCFPEGIIYEDFASIPTLAKYNPKIYYLNRSLYNYIQSDESLMRSKGYKTKYEDIFRAVDVIYDHLKDTEYLPELEYLYTYHMLYLANLNFYKYRKFNHMKRISNIMKERFPNWTKNILVNSHFDKKQLIYMKLFYHKLYFIIDLYQLITLKKKGD